MPEKLEVTHIQPMAVVELSISTKGVRTWPIKCRGNEDQEVLDRVTAMNTQLLTMYGDPANLS